MRRDRHFAARIWLSLKRWVVRKHYSDRADGLEHFPVIREHHRAVEAATARAELSEAEVDQLKWSLSASVEEAQQFKQIAVQAHERIDQVAAENAEIRQMLLAHRGDAAFLAAIVHRFTIGLPSQTVTPEIQPTQKAAIWRQLGLEPSRPAMLVDVSPSSHWVGCPTEVAEPCLPYLIAELRRLEFTRGWQFVLCTEIGASDAPPTTGPSDVKTTTREPIALLHYFNACCSSNAELIDVAAYWGVASVDLTSAVSGPLQRRSDVVCASIHMVTQPTQLAGALDKLSWTI